MAADHALAEADVHVPAVVVDVRVPKEVHLVVGVLPEVDDLHPAAVADVREVAVAVAAEAAVEKTVAAKTVAAERTADSSGLNSIETQGE